MDLMGLKTRKALTSSGDEVVSDGDKHSPFSQRLLDLLARTKPGDILTTSGIKSGVESNQPPNPRLGAFGSGVPTSEFVFKVK